MSRIHRLLLLPLLMMLLTGCTHTLRLGGEANNTVNVKDWGAFEDTEEYGEQQIFLVEESNINNWGEEIQNSNYYAVTNDDVVIMRSKSDNGQFQVIFKGMESNSKRIMTTHSKPSRDELRRDGREFTFQFIKDIESSDEKKHSKYAYKVLHGFEIGTTGSGGEALPIPGSFISVSW